MYSALGVLTPPAVEPLTVEQVRRHIRVFTDDEDDLIAAYLEAARTTVEQFLGRALITQTLRWVSARVQPPGQFPLFPFTAYILPLWFPYGEIFRRPVELPRSPVSHVVSVSTGQWGDADTVLDASQYFADTSTEPARLRLLHGTAPFESDHVAVNFVAGYGAPAAVPAPIKLAILMLTAFYYENRGDAGGEMPDAARALLWPYRLYSFGG